MYITDNTLDMFIKEDVPYIDLTTSLLGIGDKMGVITFKARELTVIACIEEVERIFKKLNIEVKKSLPSGTVVDKGDIFLVGEGRADNLHMAWKLCLNILEYCCGIATRTKKLVDAANEVSSNISVVTTRKSFPGTKELTIKSIMAGGAMPHRLGLSETVLVFKNHTEFLGGVDGLISKLPHLKTHATEKKIIIEVENSEDALKLAKANVDGLQFDKFSCDELKEVIRKVKEINPNIVAIATGGVNSNNVKDYAQTGADAIATTSVYFGKPSDIGASIKELKR